MSDVGLLPDKAPELWVMGVCPDQGRDEIIREYLAAAGYATCLATIEQIGTDRPLGIVLDISPHSLDGWGLLLQIKKNPAYRNIPVLPVFLSEKGKVGGVFPVAGFFTLPVDGQYLLERLSVFGLTEEAETWDLQALVVSRSGEEKLSMMLESAGFEVVKAYTAKEALALATLHPKYLSFSNLMLPDMSVFELLEKFRLFPYSHNMPVFVLLKDELKEGEKTAMSREIAHLVSKKQLSKSEFLKYLRNRS